MKIILAATDDALASAWQQHCGDLKNVCVHRGSILDADCDAVVSPANSFAFMDGGIDMAYSQHFGWHVQARLQSLIRDKHHGELLIGLAEIVETGNVKIPFLIAAPTMRVPMKLQESANPYLAARAVFLLVQHGTFEQGALAGERIADAVKTVAFPGLGTGVGGIGPQTCAIKCGSRSKKLCWAMAFFRAPGQRRPTGIRGCTRIVYGIYNGEDRAMPTLILPPRYTPDSNALWKAAIDADWETERLQGWRVPEGLAVDSDIVLYGEPLFAAVVADQLRLALLEPPFQWTAELPEGRRGLGCSRIGGT